MIKDYMKLRSVKKGKAHFLNAFDSLTGLFQSKPIGVYHYVPCIKVPTSKILVIRNDRIGDLVLTMGAMKSLRKKFPLAHITFMGSELNSSLIKGEGLADKVISLTPFWQARTLSSLWKYIKTLRYMRRQRYDAGIDMRCSMLNIIFLLWLGKVKKRMSYYNFNGGKAFLTDPVFYDRHEHNTKSLHRLLEKGFRTSFPFYLPEIKGAGSIIAHKKYICICPGTGNILQRWNPKKFRKLAAILAKSYTVYLVGSMKDRRLISYIKAGNPDIIPVIDKPLSFLPALFKHSACIIAADGGPMHVAWASGAKVIALWGPTDLLHIGPLRHSTVINPPMPCKPCLRLRKSCIFPPGSRCMDQISVKEVLDEVHRVC